MNFITADDVRGFKVGCGNIDLDCFSDEEITGVITVVTDLIEMITNNKWAQEELTLRFDGSGRSKLFLAPTINYKLAEFTSITLADDSCCKNCFDQDDIINQSYWLDLGCRRCCSSCGRKIGVFPKGCKNIIIEGTWGEEAPAALKRAAILMTLEKLVPGSITGGGSSCSTIAGNVRQASWSDFQVTFDTKITGSLASTGIMEVDRILQYYINTGVDLFLAIVEDYEAPATSVCRNW